MIHRNYDKKQYNCATHVLTWYESRGVHLVDIVAGQEWTVRFMRMLRRKFTKAQWPPKEGDLVLMGNPAGQGWHVGVYTTGMVEHCYAAPGGQTIRTPSGMIKATHNRDKISIWRLSDSTQIPLLNPK